MKIVLQHVNFAELKIENEVIERIEQGYLLLVGFTHDDTFEKVDKLVNKIKKLRTIPDAEGKMNLSLEQIEGEVLSISQFTLYANLSKGNRPSFSDSMAPDEASKLFDYFNEQLVNNNIRHKKGVFGGDKQLLLENSGPITLIFEE